MPYDPQSQSKPEEKKSLFGVIIHSFFVVPFLLAVFSILLFSAVRILTMEKRSVYDYLQDVKTGGATKRWQGAFELSRILSNKDAVPKEEKFVTEMTAAFEASKHDDDRVRQYLAMAMARTGEPNFVEVLLKDLPEEKDENLYAIISALGILRSNQAIDVLLKYLDSDNPSIRLAAVIALGNIGDTKAVEPLKRILNDVEPNVTWDAAVALAKLNDQSGRSVILKLLDREYLNGFKQIDPQQKSRIVLVAMEASAGWNDPDINAILQKLFESDKNMNVRALARKILDQHK
jgi:HEAT repeat protein